MNLAGSLRRLGACPDGPGAAFIGAYGEEIDKSQHGVGRADEAVQARLFFSQVCQKGFGFLAVQFGHFFFDFCGNGNPLGSFFFRLFTGCFDEFVGQGVCNIVFRHVEYVEHRFQGDKVQFLQHFQVIL